MLARLGAAIWPLAAPAPRGERVRQGGILCFANGQQITRATPGSRHSSVGSPYLVGSKGALSIRFAKRWSDNDAEITLCAAELARLGPDASFVAFSPALPGDAARQRINIHRVCAGRRSKTVSSPWRVPAATSLALRVASSILRPVNSICSRNPSRTLSPSHMLYDLTQPTESRIGRRSELPLLHSWLYLYLTSLSAGDEAATAIISTTGPSGADAFFANNSELSRRETASRRRPTQRPTLVGCARYGGISMPP